VKKNLAKIIDLMREMNQRDILSYDPEFLLKILEKRRKATGRTNGLAYYALLKEDSKERENLNDSLHISYTSFFRDPLTFAILEQIVLPSLIINSGKRGQIRIWSAGCAGGKEAYSVAMILAELLEAAGEEINFHIFATDISEKALEEGQSGSYHVSQVQEIKMKYLSKYFDCEGNSYTIKKQIKELVDFSFYDMLDAGTVNPPDSIYGDSDLVSRSNLLV